jgi:uncharacterized protein (DUF1330 family)
MAQISIHDQARYDRYAARFLGVLQHFEGRLLASDEAPEVLEGEWSHQKVVLIEFKDAAEAKRWATSPEYREIAVDREASTVATVLSFRSLHRWAAR